MVVGDVVRVEVRNQSDGATDFAGGMVVPGTGLDDLRTRPFDTMTRVRMSAPGIAPGTNAEVLLHVDRVGPWAATCTVPDGEVHHPAFLQPVDD